MTGDRTTWSPLKSQAAMEQASKKNNINPSLNQSEQLC